AAPEVVAEVTDDEVVLYRYATLQSRGGDAEAGVAARGEEIHVAARLFDRWLFAPGRGWLMFPDGLSLSAPFDALAEFEHGRHPRTVSLNDPALESIRAMVATGDAEGLAAAAHLEDLPCGVRDTGGFPCAPGVEDGTLSPMFNFVSCHGDPRYAFELADIFAAWFTSADGTSAEIYAAFEPEWNQDVAVLVFVLEDEEALTLSVLPSGEIAHAQRGCGPVPPTWAIDGVDDFLLAPPSEGARGGGSGGATP
ncbi:MAG: hypothetical protein WD058_06315, partial [Dehalococcoidia bacterium]